MSDTVERCKELGIRFYTGSFEEGILLARWWEDMLDCGDLDKVFPKHSQPVQCFMGLFKPPRALFYTLTDDGAINRAIWTEEVPSSVHCVHFGVWLAAGERHSKHSVQLLDAVYTAVFEHKNVVFGTTKQPRILDLHRKMGYTVFGPIPTLFDDEEGYIVYCTKQSYLESRFHKAAQRSLK